MTGHARHTDEQVLRVTALRLRRPARFESRSSRDWITVALIIGAAILATAAVGPGHVAVLIAIVCLLVVGHRCACLEAELKSSVIAVSAARAQTRALADQEREKIERDLQDGAQRRLVGLGIKLELAAERQPT